MDSFRDILILYLDSIWNCVLFNAQLNESIRFYNLRRILRTSRNGGLIATHSLSIYRHQA